jgi:hypothetical protein
MLANKMHQLKYNKTDHKTPFILGANSYMFRQPENGPLVLKHVGVGTWYEGCFMISFFVFELVNFIG